MPMTIKAFTNAVRTIIIMLNVSQIYETNGVRPYVQILQHYVLKQKIYAYLSERCSMLMMWHLSATATARVS